jgi:hypothetical protein
MAFFWNFQKKDLCGLFSYIERENFNDETCLLRSIERTKRKESLKVMKQTDKQTQTLLLGSIENTNRKECLKLMKETDKQTKNAFIEKSHPTLHFSTWWKVSDWMTCDIHHHQPQTSIERKEISNSIKHKCKQTHRETNIQTDLHTNRKIAAISDHKLRETEKKRKMKSIETNTKTDIHYQCQLRKKEKKRKCKPHQSNKQTNKQNYKKSRYLPPAFKQTKGKRIPNLTKKTDKQTNKQTNRQTNKQTNKMFQGQKELSFIELYEKYGKGSYR